MPNQVVEESVSMQVRTRLRELVLPLRAELDEINRRLVVLERERKDLREAQQQISKTIERLEGTQAVANGAGALAEKTYEAKRKAVETYLGKHKKELTEPFTSAEINRRMKQAGVVPIMSPEITGRAIKELHENGVVRAHKVIKGGGMSYLIVGNEGGSNAT